MSNTANMSARERIESLVDANSFVEIGARITKRMRCGEPKVGTWVL